MAEKSFVLFPQNWRSLSTKTRLNLSNLRNIERKKYSVEEKFLVRKSFVEKKSSVHKNVPC